MKQKPFVEDIETYAQDIVDTVRRYDEGNVVSFRDKWRAIFHAIWLMDAAATTGLR